MEDMHAKVLTQKFFNRPTLRVAKGLLGKYLVRRTGRRKIALMLAEVEAYDGPQDKASHASRGKTPRNKPMFGEAGNLYVYFTYGMHWMLNVVTGPAGYPAAVLVRAGRKEDGFLIKGPARLTKYLKIDKKFNGSLTGVRVGLWFEDRGIKIKPANIVAGKRVGVDYAGNWAKKRYNFKLRV